MDLTSQEHEGQEKGLLGRTDRGPTKTTNTELKIHKYKVRKHTNTDRKPPQIQKYKEENHTNPAGLKIQPRLLQPCVSPCILCRQLQLPIHPDVKLLQMVRFVGALAPISP